MGNAEDYVHRIGRTGRATDKGDAYTFVQNWGDEKKAQQIMDIMNKAQQKIPDALAKICGVSTGGSSWDEKKDDDWKKDEWKADEEWKSDDQWKKDDEWKKDEWKKDEEK